MSAITLREKLDAIDAARDVRERWSRGHYLLKYGKHPGGPLVDAQERFYEAVVNEIERLQKLVAELQEKHSPRLTEEKLAA